MPEEERSGARSCDLRPQLRPVAVHLVEVVAAVGGAPLGVDRAVQVGAAAAGPAREPAVGLLPRQAARAYAGAGQTVLAGQRRDVGREPRVDPRLPGADVLGVRGEPRPELEPGRRGDLTQPFQRRPGPLRVHVVRGQRRHPAPVVDPRTEQPGALRRPGGAVDEVGGCLHAHLGAEHDPGDGDRGDVLLEPEVVAVPHRGLRLGPEVLHDHLLDRAVLPRHLADREDRLRPLRKRLADPDQDAGRERDVQPAGVLEHTQPHRRVLVGRAVVGPAPLGEQPRRGGLEHHPHRRRHRLEPVELLPGHHPRVEVRQQPGLLQHPDRHRPHVVQGRVVALLVEPLPGPRPAVLGSVAEGEQRLGAAQLGAPPGDVEHLVGGEVHALAGALEVPGRGDERAVVAPVAAQPGQWDEHLGGVGHHTRTTRRLEARVTDPGRDLTQPLQVLPPGGQQHRSLVDVERRTALGPGQGAADLLRCRGARVVVHVPPRCAACRRHGTPPAGAPARVAGSQAQ